MRVVTTRVYPDDETATGYLTLGEGESLRVLEVQWAIGVSAKGGNTHGIRLSSEGSVIPSSSKESGFADLEHALDEATLRRRDDRGFVVNEEDLDTETRAEIEKLAHEPREYVTFFVLAEDYGTMRYVTTRSRRPDVIAGAIAEKNPQGLSVLFRFTEPALFHARLIGGRP